MKRIFLLALTLSSAGGVFAQTTVLWGDANSRTEYRQDAGLRGDAGALSGFFQANAPVNYPAGASGWWHLLDVRHSNASNNFAMQFAGSFNDQYLYFRKTNNDPAMPWSRILTETGGKVGIRTGSPTEALQIGDFPNSDNNKLLIPGTYNFEKVVLGEAGNGATMLEFVNHASLTQSYGIKMGTNIDKYGSGLFITSAPSANTYETLTYHDQPAIFVSVADNSVGIGSVYTNGYKLAVAGSMIAERIKVKAAGTWPDYVFEKDYPLPSLKSTAAFIREHKHLPEMPAAAEVDSAGLDLGDMNARLLKKVEELTLHLICQQEEIEKLQQQNREILLQVQKVSQEKVPRIN